MLPSSDETIVVTNMGQDRFLGSAYLPHATPIRVPIDFVEKFGWDAGLRFDYTPFRDVLRTVADDGRPLFDFWAPMSAVDGYGRHALDIWRGFQQIGVEAQLRNRAYIAGSYQSDFLDPVAAQQVRENNAKPPAKVGLAMSVPYDPQIWSHDSIFRLVITQFETDRIPEKHIEAVNRCDHLITTGRFQVSVWRRSGLKIPISTLTAGIDTDWFQYHERSNDGPFKVLVVGALTERKNPLGAIRIFQHASQGDPAWKLTIKTRNTDQVKAIREAVKGDPRIELVVGNSHPRAILDLYRSHHAFLFPSKGEGTGLPPLEAMATGMEVVCADNSGMSDYLSERWAYPIKTAHMEQAMGERGWDWEYIRRYGAVGNWWVPDEHHGAKQLRRAFDNWCRGKGKGAKAAEYVRKNHTLAHQAESVLATVTEYLVR